MNNACIYDPYDECLHNCKGCPRSCRDDVFFEDEFDPFDKYDLDDCAGEE